MDRSKWQYQIIPKAISLIFILLFVYAATSKLLDYGQFQFQLSKSPYVSQYSNCLGWGIPFIEYCIAILLAYPKYMLTALYASLGIMIMFTGYIYAVLEYSDFRPCSCGGIISSLDWEEHLVFNLLFIALALTGITLIHKNKTDQINNNTT